MGVFSHNDRVIRKGEKNRDRTGLVDDKFSHHPPKGRVYVYWNDTNRTSCIDEDKLMLVSDLPKQEEILDRDVKYYWTGKG